jgi:hypothetical protein
LVKLKVIDGTAQPSKLSDGKLSYPSDPPTWTATRKGLRLRVNQEPFPCNPRKASDWLSDDLYTNREIIFAIEAETDDRLVALGRFQEWRQNWSPDGVDVGGTPCMDTFRIVAEDHSTNTIEMSEVVWRMWGGDRWYDYNLFDYGNLLVFDRLRMAAASTEESGIAWKLINHLIKRRSKEPQRARLMVLKAYPLEFEADATGHPQGKRAYDRALKARQNAMRRLYRHRLDMQELPGGYNEWMWRALGPGIKPPKLTRRKDPAGEFGKPIRRG